MTQQLPIPQHPQTRPSPSPTRPSFVPPLPIGQSSKTAIQQYSPGRRMQEPIALNGGSGLSPTNAQPSLPAAPNGVMFYPSDDDDEVDGISDSQSSLSRRNQEESKRDEDVERQQEGSQVHQAQQQIPNPDQIIDPIDNDDFQSPERQRRNIQEQQTCWRQRNGSTEPHAPIEPMRRFDQDGGNHDSPIAQNRAEGFQHITHPSHPSSRPSAHHLQKSPDPIPQLQTICFQSPDKRGKYVDQNPESPSKMIALEDQRRVVMDGSEGQSHAQASGAPPGTSYDVLKAALTLQQQNNTDPNPACILQPQIRKSQSYAPCSFNNKYDATRCATINDGENNHQNCQLQQPDFSVLDTQQQQQQIVIIPEVYMRCVTWTRDSNGLFDYESKNISKKNIKTQTGGRVVRIGEEVQLVSKSQKMESLAILDADNKKMVDPQRMVVIERSKNGLGNFMIRNDTCKRMEDVEAQHTNNPDHLPQNMFIVVRNTKSTINNQDYRLCRGDTIKLGRIKFKVKMIFGGGVGEFDSPSKQRSSPKDFEACESEGYSSEDEDQAFKTIDIDMSQMSERSKASQCLANSSQPLKEPKQQVPDTKRDGEKANRQCKFCWMAESTETNPLLSACQCDGSMRFIHFQCLKQWISEKMVRKQIDLSEAGTIFTYTWKQFECEICKQPYPLTFKSKVNEKTLVYGIVNDLIQPDMPIKSDNNDPNSRVPYLLIQSLPFEKTSGRVVHLIVPDKSIPDLPPLENDGELDMPDQRHIKVFKMGRGHESSVRICDISVSRCHTLIKFDPKKSQFQLEDNLSKFGTLVLPKTKDIELEPNCTKAVQIGRSVISFTVKEVEKIIQPKPLSQSPKRLTQHQNSTISNKELRMMAQETQGNSTSLQKMKSAGISDYVDGCQGSQIQEQLDKTQIQQQQQIVERKPDVSPFLDQDQQQIELMLQQKIFETNQKIEKLMKCESKYIEQLKQSLNDPNKQSDEKIEEALIKAANSLIQAKYQLDEVDKNRQVSSLSVKPKSGTIQRLVSQDSAEIKNQSQIISGMQSQQQKHLNSSSSPKYEEVTSKHNSQIKIEQPKQSGSASKVHRSLTADKKKGQSHTFNPQQQQLLSKSDQKYRKQQTNFIQKKSDQRDLDGHGTSHGKKKEEQLKSTFEQVEDIISKFSPERLSKNDRTKVSQQRISQTPMNDGISPYQKHHQIVSGASQATHPSDSRKYTNITQSRSSFKKESKFSIGGSNGMNDTSIKKQSRDQQHQQLGSHSIIEDYRVPTQISKKSQMLTKSPSPKRTSKNAASTHNSNLSPFLVQSNQKPIKTSKVTKTVSKHYNDSHNLFSDHKQSSQGHARYLNNQSPLNKGDFRPFNPIDDRVSDHKISHQGSQIHQFQSKSNNTRQSNPFRVDSYDINGAQNASNNISAYAHHKMNNYLSGNTIQQPSSSSYLNEFNDAHYRQTLSNQKMSSGISQASRLGTNPQHATFTDLYDSKHTKLMPQRSSYNPQPQQSGAYTGTTQSRFFNNYIGSGVVSSTKPLSGGSGTSAPSDMMGGTASRFNAPYGAPGGSVGGVNGATSTYQQHQMMLRQSQGATAVSGAGKDGGRYSSGIQGYQRGYY